MGFDVTPPPLPPPQTHTHAFVQLLSTSLSHIEEQQKEMILRLHILSFKGYKLKIKKKKRNNQKRL